jgi:hypothetical protein
MGFGLRYRTSDGAPRFTDVATLDEAVAEVERLRNEEDVADVKVYREVPITFRPYYRVVVDGEATEVPVPPAPEPALEPVGAAQPVGDGPGAVDRAPLQPPPGAMPIPDEPRRIFNR